MVPIVRGLGLFIINTVVLGSKYRLRIFHRIALIVELFLQTFPFIKSIIENNCPLVSIIFSSVKYPGAIALDDSVSGSNTTWFFLWDEFETFLFNANLLPN